MKNRVVITGDGSISPLGFNSKSLWENLINGQSGVDYIQQFDTENFSVKIAGEVKDFNPNEFFDSKDVKRLDRFTMFGLIAAKQAIEKSNYLSSDAGVIVGTGVGGMHTLEEEHSKYINKGQRGVSPFYVPKMIPNIAGGQIAIKNNLNGLNFSMSTACSSATDAIGMAYRLISDGHISAMICGGAEGSITPLTLSGFANMKALSKNNDNPSEASKPFDKERDGFILSEGAGMLFMENLESALNREAEILGEIIGYGITNDAYHITQPHKDSVGAISAIEMAINEANIKVEDIDYINAHGTSTYFNDMLETQAIKNVLGNHAKDVSISSTKSMTGHLLGAAGAIEAIACINAINYNKVPPTVNFKTPDPECNLNYTPNVAIDRNVEIAMSNSFGFGGHNSVIILKKFSS
ncbi:MAG: beta-ketoacyl-ACP synthase II [Candidatus Marinimicrobia bacterium]|nr:beta-ketoacyl-ACP synthase II [Candidatus Neomarinimicrobiota bacterium]